MAITLLRYAFSILTLVAQGEGNTEIPDNATRARWLIDGRVIDETTRQEIARFKVTPGTIATGNDGRTELRWRDNLAREMTDGQLRWPRTSGFSEMRFRVDADGYEPAITHRILRGGPHLRIRVQLRPLATKPSTQ